MDSEALTVVQIALLGVACCYPLLRARRKGAEVDVFELVYPSTAYFFLLFVVRGVYTLSLGSAFISPPVDLATRRALNLAFAYLFPALAAFYAGYYGTYASQLARRLPDLPVRWSASRLASWGWAATAAGAASYLLLIQSLGGFSAYLSSKSETLTAAGTSYLAIGNSLLPAIFHDLGFAVGVGRHRIRREPPSRSTAHAVLLRDLRIEGSVPHPAPHGDRRAPLPEGQGAG